MNKARRKTLEEIHARLLGCYADLEQVKDEEQDAFDNLPESLQSSQKGETMEEYIYDIESVMDELDSIIANLNDIIER